MILDSIIITPLKIIDVEGGNVFHVLKQSDAEFFGFGECYFSSINKNAIKAWKRHKKMTMNLVVPIGNVNFTFFSSDLSKCKSIIAGENNYQRITVPPMTWFGFQGISEGNNLILNIADISHDPDEVERIDIKAIQYNWSNL